MTQSLTVPKGECFQFKVIMQNFMDGSTTVEFNGSALTGSPIGADGTFFFGVDNREGLTDITGDLRFLGSDGPVGDFELDFAGISTKLCSECFCIQDDFDCALEFAWDNNNGVTNKNAYGFDYETLGMEHFMLIQGIIYHGIVSRPETSITETSVGQINFDKVQLRKTETLYTKQLKPIPEYIIDAFYAAMSHNGATINDVPYVSLVDNNNPNWDNTARVTNFQHPIIKNDQDFNLNCG